MFFGVDPANLTSRALEALSNKDLEHIAVDVVLGRITTPGSGGKLAAKRPGTTLHAPLPSLAG